ncbi:DUF6444 domain-containing protein [Desulfosarcina ovata]|uniref:Uncharacterized protein n=1 Tax=Desulfosarcina ovata subsp. ovata TaxID=2752305 RepID=A0A5K8A6V7_9BACT|nr:DUF6444 domain-containing protein [Desulfosarcina ovata]BBO88104.1 hypothetical protein DSCOOX_12840 [Desulfosarcina ovata subsp. ovata]
MGKRFGPEDLNQSNGESLNKLRKSDLIDLTLRLRDFGIDLYERLNQDSSNSSRPPSSDSPYKCKMISDGVEQSNPEGQKREDEDVDSEPLDGEEKNAQEQKDSDNCQDTVKRNAGRQPGSQGFWRKEKPQPDHFVDHHPQQCIICSAKLAKQAAAHTGFYTYELEKTKNGLKPLIVIIARCVHAAMTILKDPAKGMNRFLRDASAM